MENQLVGVGVTMVAKGLRTKSIVSIENYLLDFDW